ncbi:hypothetical protein D623_10027380 [Myotis brandtii]|uniref:Small integral membrane protein 20 n=1 Tax=Myotis brandtii TaxID=109478 RepID=S7NEB6_MYOBR|nr:hypothetical protein D623_10027380 [Myotis brandtii]
MSRNLRTALIFGGFISLIGAAFYPIYFRPLMRPEEYKPRGQRCETRRFRQVDTPSAGWTVRKLGSRQEALVTVGNHWEDRVYFTFSTFN